MENSSTRFMQSCKYIVYKEEEDCFRMKDLSLGWGYTTYLRVVIKKRLHLTNRV